MDRILIKWDLERNKMWEGGKCVKGIFVQKETIQPFSSSYHSNWVCITLSSLHANFLFGGPHNKLFLKGVWVHFKTSILWKCIFPP